MYKNILFIVLFFNLVSIASDSTLLHRLRFSYDFGYGKVLKTAQVFPQVSDSRYHNLYITYQTDGSKHWHHNYAFPEFGINVVYSNIGNDTILGNLYSIIPVWMLHIWDARRFGLMVKLGIGFAYFDKKFDPVENPHNTVISSSISNYTTVGFYARYLFAKRIMLYGGFSVVHSSNGHTYIPNASLNDIPYSLGFQYRVSQFNKPERKFIPYNKEPWVANLRFGLGYNEQAGSITPSRGPKFPIYAIAPYLSKRLSPKNDFHLGAYLVYFTGYYDFIKYWEYFKGKERKNSFVSSIFTGHEFIIGKKFGFVTELNVNIYNPFFKQINITERKPTSFTYTKKYLGTRIGLFYYLTNGKLKAYNKRSIVLGLCLKSVMMQADYVEVNIGYGF